MNIETINKWLDEEYGCSYTRLEELHDFYFEKYCDLKQENKQLKEDINKYKRLGYKHLQEQNNKLEEKIDKAIEILKLCNSQCAKETIDILKGGSNE